MDTLRQRLATAMRSSTRSSVSDGFRMPVDRVFSLAGVGTVVTGTPWTGRLLIGDAVLVLPLGLRGRVRSLESYGRPAERAEPAVRTAVGLSGIDRAQLSRGAVVVTDELPWASGTALDVEIALDRRIKRPLSSRTRVRVLLGTEEVMARVYPRSPIEPGTRSMARLKLETPLVGRSEDRFVLRSYSPVTTIGGGRVVDPLPPRKRADWPAGLASRDPAERLQGLVERRPGGIDSAQLPLLLGVPPRVAGEVARRAPGLRLLGHLWTPTSLIESVGARALGLLRSYHREHPSSPGMPLETLRHSLKASEVVIEAALADYAQAGKLRRSDSLVTLAGFVPRVVGGDVEIDRIVGILSSAHLTPPSVAELERSTGHRDLHPLLRLAAASGRIEAVERDRYYTREALEQFALVLTDLGRAGAILPAAVRDRLGLSRKFVIPLLEWADGRGITVREGDGRRLRQKVRAGTDLP
jgi:selenocysteine-specific elongation factor